VPLTPGRSIAVDKALACLRHARFFIEGEFADRVRASKTPFHRLIIAPLPARPSSDTRAPICYFGSGTEAGRVSGGSGTTLASHLSLKSPIRSRAAAKCLVPDDAVVQKSQTVFPQVDPLKEPPVP